MSRKLTKLEIAEVSAVDRGAGVGCQIKLLKRDERTKSMSQIDIAKRNMDYALAEQAHAKALYPGDPKALAKFHAAGGLAVTNAYTRHHYEKMQLDTALGDASIYKRRDGATGGQERHDNDQPGHETTAEHFDANDAGAARDGTHLERDEDGNQRNPKSKGRFARKVAALMKSERLSFDAACTRLIKSGAA